ncbi:MAG: 4-hydroxybenzoate octaprenyltransferase [Paracidovorax wautersii]|uniref:4-hydroxybenzoate octaprenyltransferase n=1 Tax=Paracidovorax wautersii TaxID=1177982 RepID=A0A7V8FLY1_9BURK|nr:MAG: 4-hydroxybenzoate octaprenyltransferase [Paracidovorax wautersii]
MPDFSRPSPTDPTPARPSRLALYLQLIRWDRPVGWLVLLWPTLGALWIAAGGFPGGHLLLAFVVGTVLMRSAGCCINDVADREFDRHVKRTTARPVTAGLVSVREALTVGAVLALAAFAVALTLNAATLLWTPVALAVAMLYPYAKRYVSMPQAVLGVAFSFGIPMAFTAVQGGALLNLFTSAPLQWADAWHAVPALAWWLVLGNVAQVLAYDTEYAMVDRDDDLKLGMKTSAITLGRWDVAAVMGFYGVFLVIWGWALFTHVALWAAVLATAVAVAQVAWHWTLIRSRSRDGCFRAFRANHWLGLTVFLGFVFG